MMGATFIHPNIIIIYFPFSHSNALKLCAFEGSWEQRKIVSFSGFHSKTFYFAYKCFRFFYPAVESLVNGPNDKKCSQMLDFSGGIKNFKN